MNGKTGLRIVSALVLIAAIAGIAFFAFQAGFAKGSPVTIQAPSGEANVAPVPYPYYGYGMPLHHPFGFGLGCFGPLLAFFLFIVVLKSFSMLFWGPRWGRMHGRGPWGAHWEGGAPPMFDEWHKKAHDEPTEEKKE